MLEFIRKNASSWAVRVVLVVIAFSLAFFLGGGAMLGGVATNVATVGEVEISQTEFQLARNRNEAYFRDQYGGNLSAELLRALDIPSLTLRQLVDGAVLRNEAENIGLHVPDEAVRRAIEQIEAFRRNGGFSPSTYKALLRSQQLSPSRFEDSMRADLLANQLTELVRQGVFVTEEEAYEDYVAESREIVLSYVKLSAETFADDVTVDDAGLATFFEENSEKYRVPDKSSVRYLTYSPEQFSKDVEVTDERIEEFYELNKDGRFQRKELVTARHILKKFDEGADEETKKAAREALEAIKARIEAGEDFAEVAKAESEDAGSGALGGDLGAFGRGKMVPPFEEAAFAQEVGELGDIVESKFGYHLIEVSNHTEPGTIPLDEVREMIAKELSEEGASDVIFDASAEDAALIADGTSFDVIAEGRGLEIKTTPLIGRGEIVPDIGVAPKFVDAAVALTQKGDTSEPIKVGSNYYILTLAERKASYVPELDEVREDVEADYRAKLAEEAAQAEADAIVARLQSGESLSDIAEENEWTLEETEPFSPTDQFIPGLGNIAGLQDVAFRTKNDDEPLPRSFVNRGAALVFVRKSLTEGDREGFEAEKDERMEAIRVAKEQRVLGEFLRGLKENTQIAYNATLLDPLLGGTSPR